MKRNSITPLFIMFVNYAYLGNLRDIFMVEFIKKSKIRKPILLRYNDSKRYINIQYEKVIISAKI